MAGAVAAFLLALAGAGPAFAAIVFQGSATGHNSGTGASSNFVEITLAEVVAGEVLVAQIARTKDIVTTDQICPPEDWILVTQNHFENKYVQTIYRHLVPASAAPITYRWDFKTSAGTCGTTGNPRNGKGVSGGILRYSGVDTTTPIDAFQGNSGGSSPPYRALSVTTTQDGAQVLRLFTGEKHPNTFGPAATRVYNVGADNGDERTIAAFHANQALAGPTGNFDATQSSSGEWVSATVALRPAQADPEVTVSKTSPTTTVPENGGAVTYTFTVENTGAVSFEITSLEDDQFGTLAGDADCQVGTELDPGDSCDFDAVFAVPPGVTGGTFVNSFTAEVEAGNAATDEDSDDHTVTYTDVPPQVTVTKSSATTDVPETGDTVSYTFTVENTGAVSFTITSLEDDQFGTLAGDADCQVGTVLGPGDSCDFVAAFPVPPGSTGDTFVNTFTALVTDTDGTTDSDSDDHTVTYTDVPPEVTVTKSSVTTDVPETGDTVSYTFTVENTGAVSFTITSLEDDQFGTLAGDADCQVGTVLGPGDSCDFVAAFPVPAGTTGDTFVNTFTALVTDADGTTDSDSDDHSVTYTDVPPQVTVTKTSATTEVPETGDTVSYTFTVENTGTVSFEITSLTDDQFGTLAGDADCQVGTVLGPGDSCDFVAAFPVPAGTTGDTFVNTFTALVTDADGTTDSDSDDHSVTYTDVAPEVTVTKTSATTEVPETGDTVSYTFTVENTGTVSFTITTLEDDQFGTLAGDADCQVGTVLGPGDSCDFVAAFDVPAGTTGDTFVNTFTALVTDDDGTTDSDSDDHTVTYDDVAPQVTVTKTSDTTEVPETGDTVSYTFTVENTGTVSFEITSLEDDQFGTLAGDADCQVGTVLGPGDSCDFVAAFDVPAGSFGDSFVNVFTAVVTDGDGTTGGDSDSHAVSYFFEPQAPEPSVLEIPTASDLGLLLLALLLGGAAWVTLRRLG